MQPYPATHKTLTIGDQYAFRQRIVRAAGCLEDVALMAIISLFWGVIIYLAVASAL